MFPNIRGACRATTLGSCPGTRAITHNHDKKDNITMSDTSLTDGAIVEDYAQASSSTSVIDSPNESGRSNSAVIVDAIQRLQSNQTRVYSTVVGDDFDSKLKTLSAVTNAEPIMENLGKHIDLENIVVQPVELTDPKTGEVTTQPRVILLDADGTAFYGISPVLLKAIETFAGVLGQPVSWPEPVGVKVTRDKSNNGFFFFNMTLDNPPKAAAKK